MTGPQSGTAHAGELSERESGGRPARRRFWREWTTKEDWWSIWIGLGFVLAAYVLYASGASIRWLAVSPAKWAPPTLADSG